MRIVNVDSLVACRIGPKQNIGLENWTYILPTLGLQIAFCKSLPLNSGPFQDPQNSLRRSQTSGVQDPVAFGYLGICVALRVLPSGLLLVQFGLR